MSEIKLSVKILILTLSLVPNPNLELVTRHLKFPTYKMYALLPGLPTSQHFIFKNVGVNVFHKLKKGLTPVMEILRSH